MKIKKGDSVKLGGPLCDPRLSNKIGLVTDTFSYGYEVLVTDAQPTTWGIAFSAVKEKING